MSAVHVHTPTTAQSLGALLKSARDIMRKDKGLNGDLDRLPMLTWIMFLKFLDDLEIQREGEAKLAGKKFKPAIDAPQIDPGNSLRFKLTDIGERDRVDVILTNPPFGGEEERGIQSNSPEDKQTAETALLFLQLIMRKLRKQSVPLAHRMGEGSGGGPRRRGRA